MKISCQVQQSEVIGSASDFESSELDDQVDLNEVISFPSVYTESQHLHLAHPTHEKTKRSISSSTLYTDARPVKKQTKSKLLADQERYVGTHVPIFLPEKGRQDRRGRCKWCAFENIDKKSKFKCEKCNIFLCITDDIATNCWFKYHQRPVLVDGVLCINIPKSNNAASLKNINSLR